MKEEVPLVMSVSEQTPLETSKPTSVDAVLERRAFPEWLEGKNILLATESLGPVNGVSRTTLSLIEYLRQKGVNIAIAAPRRYHSELRPGRLVEVNVRLAGEPLPYNPDLAIVYPFRYDRICSRTFKPDLVYLASPASLGFQMLLQIRQLQEPPAIVCNFQTDLSAYSRILFPSGMSRYAVWLLEVVQGFLFSHGSVHTIFYPSSGIRDYLNRIGAPTGKLVKLGRGVDTSLFNPIHRDKAYREELAPNGEVILVCVCRLAPEKGFDFLAKVAIELVKRFLRFKLLIVGGNQNRFVEASVRQLFDQVKEHVIFTGFLTGTALARAYAGGDIFLHCSVTETFGLVVLEAMASSMPVVARDEGGPSEIVQHSKTGYLIQPEDVDAFVEHILLLAHDQDLRSRMMRAALAQANDTTWEKINLRAAWTLADSIMRNREQSKAMRDQQPTQNWLVARYSDLQMAVMLPVTEFLRLQVAVGIVCIFWVIAVLPLLIHGNIMFRTRWRSDFATQNWFGRTPSYTLRK